MSSNKYLLMDKSMLLKGKLDRLAAKLQGSISSTEFQTKEELLFEAVRILSEFYKGLNEPQMEVEDVRHDDLPDASVYNRLWEQLVDDFVVIFTELENIEGLSLANFNFITTEANRLTARLKTVSSKLGDYILYSLNPMKDAFFFKDSFNDLSKVEVNSPLLNESECEVGQTEGIVTLPINKEKDSVVIIRQSPVINPNSNGIVGNNQELGVQWRGETQPLLDNNPDTWFEYERVVTKINDDKEPLILDITLNIGEEKVVNHIRVNPSNFGTKTVLAVDTIETSLDGETFTNIKDDIPIAGFVAQDEENIFQLAPSSSKYAGQGLYTFTPRKVKYIHFVFHQAEPYVINTSAGEKMRYAIGIRDLDIRAYSYKPAGELVSSSFDSQDEIRKVLLQSNQNPSQISELAYIKWFVSPDDGQTWYEIQPKEFIGVAGVESATPEVLEFNGISAKAIMTSVPVNSLRIKTVLGREDDNFTEGSSSLYKRTLTTSELHSVPSAAPFTINLNEAPVDGTVLIVDPLFGSRGMPKSPYILGHTTDRLDLRKYRLPFSHLPRPSKKVLSGEKYRVEPMLFSEWAHLEVGGTEWEHATDGLSTYGTSDKVFTFDIHTGEVEFGDGTNGQAPSENEPVALWFDAELLSPSEVEDNHLATLDFHTSVNKDDMTIKRYDKIADVVEVFPRKATVIRLKNKNIDTYTDIVTKMTTAGYSTEVTYLNGKDELDTDVKWSIDTTEGIIYTRVPTPDDSGISVSYKYQPIYTLTKDDWGWANTDLLRDAIVIKESAWQTISVAAENISMTDDTTVLDVEYLSVVKGTVAFNLTVTATGDSVDETDSPFQKEVTFQDGVTELDGEMVQTTEQISAHTGSDTETFDFSETVTTDTDFAILFSDSTYFATLKNWGECTENGHYAIDLSNNQFQFFSDIAIGNPGKVTYFYSNPNFATQGQYSIDYKLGRIYTQISMDALWTLKVDYDHTDFRAEYRIARILDSESYDVDITNKSVTIKDNEILKHLLIPHGRMDSRMPYYLVNYDYVAETREKIAELKDYFSPIIKDYALKVLTKGRIY